MKTKLMLAASALALTVTLIFFAGPWATPAVQLPELSPVQRHAQLVVPFPSSAPAAPQISDKPELPLESKPTQTPVKQTDPPTKQPDPQTKPPEQVQHSALEQAMLTLINNERIAHDLPALAPDPRLVSLARLKSQDIIDYDYWHHTSPNYGTPFEMLQAADIEYRWAGENLAKAPCYETAHSDLMDSEGHRQNLLSLKFTHIGIGIIDNGSRGIVITQLFIQP